MKPGESLETLVLETEEEISTARDVTDARSSISSKLASKFRDAEAPLEFEPDESLFVLQSLRMVRDYPIIREIEVEATKMLNDYQEAYSQRTGGKYAELPDAG